MDDSSFSRKLRINDNVMIDIRNEYFFSIGDLVCYIAFEQRLADVCIHIQIYMETISPERQTPFDLLHSRQKPRPEPNEIFLGPNAQNVMDQKE